MWRNLFDYYDVFRNLFTTAEFEEFPPERSSTEVLSLKQRMGERIKHTLYSFYFPVLILVIDKKVGIAIAN